MASPTAREDLISLVTDVLSSDSIQFSVPKQPNGEDPRLALINSIPLARPIQLIELLISLFLSRSPFKTPQQDAIEPYKRRFLSIWTRRRSSKERDGLNSLESLLILSKLRLDFQRLGPVQFRFLSVLLFECLKQLSPDRSTTQSTKGRSRGKKSWGELHSIAVKILDELMRAVPPGGKDEMDQLAEQTGAVWQCLDVLTAGASWWGTRDKMYRDSILTLAKCVFRIPTVEPLLRASMRINMTPAQVHGIVGTLLEALEKEMGVPENERVNAFTPTPLSFPMLPNLDWHNFTKEYEFTSLRVLFVTWLCALPEQRCLEAAKNPLRMASVLQHSEAFKKLKDHPESGVRVALMYIRNQTQDGFDAFKPSTDMAAIQILKLYITYRASLSRFITTPSSSRTVLPGIDTPPETCIAIHGEWTLPWLWRRRAADPEFLLAVTSAWIMTQCSKGRPIRKGDQVHQIFLTHRESGFGVIHDFFRHMFNDDFVRKSDDPLAATKRLRMLFKIVVDLALLVADEHPEVLDRQFLLLLIRCCINSLTTEWIPLHGWSRACEILCRVSKHDLTETMKLAQVGESAEKFMPLFLRDMEAITTACEDAQSGNLDVEELGRKLNTLTLQVQFLTLLLSSNLALRAGISRKSYLLKTILQYITKSYTDILVGSKKAELSWMHAASIASLIEFLLVIDFGCAGNSGTETPVTLELLGGGSSGVPNILTHGLPDREKVQVVGDAVELFISRTWEMSYVTGTLCRLVAITEKEYWIEHSFIYLEVASYLRTVLMEKETHKYCIFLPYITVALKALFSHDIVARQIFLSSRLNLAVTSHLLELLFTTPTLCTACQASLLSQIATILHLFLSPPTDWRNDLLKSSGLGQHSSLTMQNVEKRAMKVMEDADTDSTVWEQNIEETREIMKVLECFDNDTVEDRGWVKMVRGLKRQLERRVKARLGRDLWDADQVSEEGPLMNKGVRYKVWRPVEGVLGVLVVV